MTNFIRIQFLRQDKKLIYVLWQLVFPTCMHQLFWQFLMSTFSAENIYKNEIISQHIVYDQYCVNIYIRQTKTVINLIHNRKLIYSMLCIKMKLFWLVHFLINAGLALRHNLFTLNGLPQIIWKSHLHLFSWFLNIRIV